MAFSKHTRSKSSNKSNFRKKKKIRISSENQSDAGGQGSNKPHWNKKKFEVDSRSPLGFYLKKNLNTPDKLKAWEHDSSSSEDYTGISWKSDRGPTLFIHHPRNISPDRLANEIRNDLVAIRQRKSISDDIGQGTMADIYIHFAESTKETDRRKYLKELQAIANQKEAALGQRYNLVYSNQEKNLIRLKLVNPPLLEPKHVVQSVADFKASMGKQNDGGGLYQHIVQSLTNYHEVLKAQLSEISHGGRVKITTAAFAKANAAIIGKRNVLARALDTYLDESKTVKFKKKSLIGRGISQVRGKSNELGIVEALKDSLRAANQNDLNEALEIAWKNNQAILKHNLETFKPLLDKQISKKGELLGEGAQGPVYSRFYDTKNRPDLPNPFEAGVKFGNAKATIGAIRAGIPDDNPEEAKRAVAAYETSRILRLDVTLFTTFIFGESDKTGKQELGLAMQRIQGFDGQKLVKIEVTDRYRLNNKKPQVYDKKLKDTWDSIIAGEVGDDYFERKGLIFDSKQQKLYEIQPRIPSVDLKLPHIQKDLADIQILDNIIGHADRNPSNWRFEPRNGTFRVRTLDNDDTFGKSWEPRNGESGSKTPGVPPIIDVYTAINVLKVTPADMVTLQDKLSEEEYIATLKRLDIVQDTIRERIKNGRLAIMPNQKIPATGDLEFLAKKSKLNGDKIGKNLLKWGSERVYQAHQPSVPTPQESQGGLQPNRDNYIAEMIHLKRKFPLAQLNSK